MTHAHLPLAALATAILAAVPTSMRAQHPWNGLSADAQIALAVRAAPPEMAAGATVQGYDASGAFVVLREGTNGLVCMAPDPKRDDFEVSCHHAGLEPFFERGRELSAQGVSGQERIQRRWEEFTAGTLAIPYGSVNYILTGSGFDPDTHEVRDPYLRWTIYTPNATPESTGLSAQPAPGAPWLMFPGTPGSHIMVTPPRSGGGAGD